MIPKLITSTLPRNNDLHAFALELCTHLHAQRQANHWSIHNKPTSCLQTVSEALHTFLDALAIRTFYELPGVTSDLCSHRILANVILLELQPESHLKKRKGGIWKWMCHKYSCVACVQNCSPYSGAVRLSCALRTCFDYPPEPLLFLSNEACKNAIKGWYCQWPNHNLMFSCQEWQESHKQVLCVTLTWETTVNWGIPWNTVYQKM